MKNTGKAVCGLESNTPLSPYKYGTRLLAIFDYGSRIQRQLKHPVYFGNIENSDAAQTRSRPFYIFPRHLSTTFFFSFFLNSCVLMPVCGYFFFFFFAGSRQSRTFRLNVHIMYVLLLLLVIRLITFSSHRLLPYFPVSHLPTPPFLTSSSLS